MKLLPRTLLGRTTLYLGGLLFISQALWIGTAKFFLLAPLKPAYEQQVSDMVAMAQALIETHPDETGLTSSRAVPFSSFETLRVVPDSAPRPKLNSALDQDFPGDLSQSLQRRFGPTALAQRQGDDRMIIWLRFPARGRLFWLVVPLNAPTTLPYLLLFLIGIGLALAVGGAYLIVFRLARRLRRVTEAVRAVGRGDPPAALEASGPQEIHDLSEGFNQMACDLRKLDADRRLMLAGISHDLRTPLTHLRIAVELAGARAEPAIAAGMVHDIEDMDAILKQFLDYARDGSEEPPEENDLDAIVCDVGDRFAVRGQFVAIELGSVPPFVFRRHALRRVLVNLTDNAVRYGKTGVAVKTRREGETVFVTVSDRGPGIRSGAPADFIKPFVREDVSRSEPGAGLGLTIVDRVVGLHGGRFRLENAEGGGLCATIELPIRPAKDAKSG